MKSDTENRPPWMNDEMVRNIPREKLDFLGRIFQDSQGKNQKEMMALMVPMMKRAKQENLTFTPQEMSAAVAAIRKYSSQEELEKIDELLKKTR